ncbi:hypothetical protein HPB51_020656 [Rhipicephalus microplus]|uniref:Uncharacterized protein n=1 Tax=Rhipicephalus microplus TaxID=6941 RepID=A0A9J6DP88_RHIMP|nr:hypothetical protein HPB51_020656 [Rhipicephalus microplus]
MNNTPRSWRLAAVDCDGDRPRYPQTAVAATRNTPCKNRPVRKREREAAASDLAKRPRYCVVALSVCNRRGDRAILQVPGRDPEGQARRSFNPARCDNDNGLIGQLPLPRTPLPPLDPLCSRYTSTCASVRVLGKMKDLDGHEHIVSLPLLRLLLLEMPCRLHRDKTTEPRPVPRRRGRSATKQWRERSLIFCFWSNTSRRRSRRQRRCD